MSHPTHKDTTKHFIRASLWTAVNSYSFFVINFIGQIILAKILIPEDYGLYAFLSGIVELCIIFLGFSNTSSFINSEGTHEDFDACFKINLIAVSLLASIGIIGYFISYFFMKTSHHGLLFLLLCTAQCFLLFGYVFMAPLQKILNFKKVSFYNGICSSGSLLCGIIFAKLHFSYWSLGLRDLVNYVVFFLIAYHICPMHVSRHFWKSAHKKQLSFGIKISFSRAMEVLYYRFSDVLVKLIAGRYILGNFYQARTVSFYPIKLMEPFTHQVLFSFFSTIKQDKNLIANRLNWINYIIVRVFLPFVFFIVIFGKDLFVFIYGQKWQLAGVYFEYFSFWIPLASLFAAALSTCYSLEKQWVASVAYMVASSLFIFGMIFLHHYFAPPLFFTGGLAAGYLFLVLMMKRIGLPITTAKAFLLPIIILFISFIMRVYVNLFLACAIFLVLYGILLLIERKKIYLLYKKTMTK